LTETSFQAGSPPRIFAALLAIIGLVLAAGGVWLVVLGGSPYYVITGIAVLASAVLLWRGRMLGAWIYVAMLTGTVIWAFWEVGLDWWALMPRVVGPAVLGLWLALPHVRKALN